MLYKQTLFRFCGFEKLLVVLITIGLLLLKPLEGFSSPPINYLSINEGLSNNSVRCIYQDKKGFMWFGTYDGLNRYDGYEFKVFRNNFKTPKSLINNWINTINEDLQGNIWIGTRQGVCIYKGVLNNFSPVYHSPKKNTKNKVISVIRDIKKDDQGNMFIGTIDMGLLICPRGDSVARQIRLHNDPGVVLEYDVPAIKIGADKKVWIFVNKKGLYVYDYKLDKIKLIDSSVTSANALEAEDSLIWVGTERGLKRYNTISHSYDKIYSEENNKLTSKDVVALALDNSKKLWIATNSDGINILNLKTDQVEYLLAGNNNHSLSSNSVNSIIEDDESRIWFGTLRGGINIIDPHKERFKTIVSETGSANTLISNYVYSFYEASDGNLWIGTDGGGISMWDRRLNRFVNYKHVPNDPTSLSDNFITDINSDSKGGIYIASYWGGVNRFDRGTKNFERYKFIDPTNSRIIVNSLTYRLYKDAGKNLWAGTLLGGLFKLNKEKKVFELFDEKLKDLFVMEEDRSGNLWAGNLSQLIKIDKQRNKHIYYTIGKPARSILEDKSRNFWIGTEGGGLILFDRKKGKLIKRYTTDEGLCSNSILNILEDNEGNLWMSTFDGISKFNVKTNTFKNYYQSDGLQSNQFSYNAALKLTTGELAFGGIKGFTFFNPEEINTQSNIPKIFFTSIKINNTPIEEKKSFITKVSSGVIEDMIIPYDQAVLSFDFAALEYSAPDKIQYAYFLEGWDRGWNYIGKIRNANYTHLSEGRYTFRVKSTNAEGVWSTDELRITISVLPPWYRTWWAYLIYLSTIGATIYYYLLYRASQTRLQYEVKLAKLNEETERAEKQKSIAELQKEKAEREKGEAELAREKAEKEKGQAELEKEKAEHEKDRAESAREQAEREKERILNEQEREVNEKKISFFTNISHEFRTPLTLIINPIKDLINKTGDEQSKQEGELSIIYRNARRMLSLVDQLLLFRKAESGLDRVKPSKLNLYNLAREVYLCFVQQAKTRRIDYRFDCLNQNLEIYADREKLEIILYNLLSNALKYTPVDGNIGFTIKDLESNVVLEVKNSGSGIPVEIGDKLFEKFYQAERKITSSRTGFGIGLFLVKNFTEQHKGEITYESQEGHGAIFILKLLKGQEHFEQAVIVSEDDSSTAFIEQVKAENFTEQVSQVQEEESIKNIVTEKQSILIVDDDEQTRHYLVQLFKDRYIVRQAENGDKGFKLTERYLPDLIISDVHMQEVSGIELCQTIKANGTLSHIPIILLTGSTSEEMQLQGVEGGADDYITKPFDNKLLIARVSNLLKSRNNLQNYFYNEITLNKSDIKISSEYKEFLEKCISIVEDHLDDENFTVKTLVSQMGMSHSNLFRRVKLVSGQSVNVFIRFIRLRKAAELLINTNYNINETAYMVGIQDIRYFREQFYKLFGMNPSDYKKRYREAYSKQYRVDKELIKPK